MAQFEFIVIALSLVMALIDITNHSVHRVLDLFDLDTGTLKRWEGINNRSDKPQENKEIDGSKTSYKVIGAK